jgi:type IV pilus secretin PilQ/predicted competence protein
MSHPSFVARTAALIAFAALALGAANAPVTLTNFDHYTEKGETHVVLGAGGPFFYTLYRPTPDSLVVEIPGLDASAQAERMRGLKTEQVLGVEAAVQKAGTPDAKTVLTFSLAPGATHSHWLQGTNLYVDLFGGAASEAAPALAAVVAAVLPAEPPPLLAQEEIDEPETEAVAVPEAAVPAPPVQDTEKAFPPATTLKKVFTEPGKVVIVGDGAMAWETFELSNPARIVVDVKGVTNGMGGREIAAQGAVERVRVSQFRVTPDKVTRVVLDMKGGASPYAVSRHGDRLEIALGADAQTASRQAKAVSATAAALPPPAKNSVSSEAAPEPKAAAPAPLTPVVLNADLDPPAFRVVRETPPAERPEWMNAPVTRYESAVTSSLQGGTVGDRMESQTIGGEVQYSGLPVTLDLKNADIKDIFRLFSEMSGLNFVLDKAIGGSITIMLRDVPWDQALDVILKNEGWGKVYQNNVVFIAPLARLAKEEADRKKLRDAQEQAEEPITKMFRLSYSKSSEIIALIKQGKILTKQGEIFEDKRGNTIFVRDVVGRVELVEQLIRVVDRSMPQVEIEARIVETTKDYAKGMGIAWGTSVRADQAHGTSTGLQFPHRVGADYAVILPAGGAFSFLDLSLGNVLDSFTLDVQLSMMERNGRGKVLSSPRVVTLNNQKANIESGVQIPYIVTTDLQINVNFVQATIQLDVTPQITNDDTVIMDISVNKREPGPTISGEGISIPSIITRRAKTQVLVRDGGTAVIGGVFQVTDNQSTQQVPGLHRIPGLGWLFRSKTQNSRNDELLIFITPRIQRMQV